MAFGNEAYKLNLTNWNYKYNYTRNLVGRSFGRCLRNRLLSGCSMRFTTRPFVCARATIEELLDALFSMQSVPYERKVDD
jgi:hypothetical protein